MGVMWTAAKAGLSFAEGVGIKVGDFRHGLTVACSCVCVKPSLFNRARGRASITVIDVTIIAGFSGLNDPVTAAIQDDLAEVAPSS